jgi:phosphatidylglycerophosphatase C
VLRDRGRLKAASVRVFLAGVSRRTLEEQAGRFAEAEAERLLRPDALRTWEAHGEAGDLRVIVTASPEAVVAPFAHRLQADVLIGTRLAWTDDDRVEGGLAGPNCRGAEKVRRLQRRFGPAVVIADAYGDTSGDREMLATATRGHMRRFTGRP